MSHDSEDSDSMIMSVRDWRQALKSPPTYRIGNRTLRIQTKFFSIFVIVCIIVLFLRYYILSGPSHNEKHWTPIQSGSILSENSIYKDLTLKQYNSTYPLTRPIRTSTGLTYRIAVVSDLDTDSKSKTESNTWISYLQKGYLMWNPSLNSVNIIWDKKPLQLKSSLSQGGRGMELSELVVFNGKLYTVDDRTGVVYEIVGNNVIPWVLLADGDGKTSKGFKSEWATVKNQNLIVGGFGKEWTNSKGEVLNYHPQWIKSISSTGEVNHINWRDNYIAIRQEVGISYPGYMIHESAAWSEIHRRWYFLPRRCSKEPYHEETDEFMGTNLLISSDEHFKDIKVSKIGEVLPSHGFSSFKFIPGSEDEVVIALKSEEIKGSVATYVTAFKIDGKILMPETKIGDIKYEGIEFI